MKLKRTDGDALTVDVEETADTAFDTHRAQILNIYRLKPARSHVWSNFGSHSHYINKVLDNNCAQFGGSFTSLGPNTAAPVLTAAVIKKFGVLQVLPCGIRREAHCQSCPSNLSTKRRNKLNPRGPLMLSSPLTRIWLN